MSDTKRTAVIVGAASLVLAGVGFGVYKAIPKPQEKIAEQTRIMETTQSGYQPADVSNGDQVASQPTVNSSASQEWKNKKFSELTEEDKEGISSSLENTFLRNATTGFLSEKDGFTMDEKKKLNADGFPNLKYTEITREEVDKQLFSIIQGFINPNIGDWTKLQDFGGPAGFQIDYLTKLGFTYEATKKYQNEKILEYKDYNPNKKSDRIIGSVISLIPTVRESEKIEMILEVEYVSDSKERYKVKYNVEVRLKNKKLEVVKWEKTK